MTVIRWVLSVASPVLALLLTFAAAVLFTYGIERLCPPEFMVSGVCTAAWYPAAETAAFCLSAAIGGFLFVLLPTSIAPSHTHRVAWLAFGAGVTYATLFLSNAGLSIIGPYASSVGGGMLATFLVHRRAANAA